MLGNLRIADSAARHNWQAATSWTHCKALGLCKPTAKTWGSSESSTKGDVLHYEDSLVTLAISGSSLRLYPEASRPYRRACKRESGCTAGRRHVPDSAICFRSRRGWLGCGGTEEDEGGEEGRGEGGEDNLERTRREAAAALREHAAPKQTTRVSQKKVDLVKVSSPTMHLQIAFCECPP